MVLITEPTRVTSVSCNLSGSIFFLIKQTCLRHVEELFRLSDPELQNSAHEATLANLKHATKLSRDIM